MARNLKRVLNEVRLSMNNDKFKLKDAPIATYILDQYRKYQTTEKQLCKAGEEMNHLSDSYATYLFSQRKWADVHGEYHAKGERSVTEVAHMVGFKMPHEPVPPRKVKSPK
jgi:hypothetical protein